MTNRRKPKLSLWSQLPQWAWKQGLRNNIDFSRNPDSSGGRPERERPQHCSDIKEAQVIISRVEYPEAEETHKPVLDIDFPAACVPSTTEGHFHLYLDKELTWPQYRRLLDALADCGIIEQGYRNASIARQYTAARVPWVRKPDATEEPAPDAEAPAPAAAAPAPQEATRPRTEHEEAIRRAEARAAERRRREAAGEPTDAEIATAHIARLPEAFQPAAADPILRNIAEAHAQRTFSAEQRASREQRAMREAEERAARRAEMDLAEARREATRAALDGVNREPRMDMNMDGATRPTRPRPERGEQVRYNAMLMRYEDGENWVSAHFMDRYGAGMQTLIQQGAVVANSVGWITLVREHGHRIDRPGSRTLHRDDVVIEEEPRSSEFFSGTATVRYDQTRCNFHVTNPAQPGRALTVTEEYWRRHINDPDVTIPEPMRTQLANVGLPVADVSRVFARAWEQAGVRVQSPLERELRRNRSERRSITMEVLEEHANRQAHEAAARAELASYYTRIPEPVAPVSGRWSAEGSDPLRDIIEARDRIVNAPNAYAYTPSDANITVSWTNPTPATEGTTPA